MPRRYLHDEVVREPEQVPGWHLRGVCGTRKALVSTQPRDKCYMLYAATCGVDSAILLLQHVYKDQRLCQVCQPASL